MSSTRGRPRGGEAVSDPSHAPTIAKSTKNIRKSSTQALPEDVPKENIEINQNKKEGDSKLTLTSPASLPVFQLQHPDIAVSTTHASSSSSAQPVLQSKLSAESLTQHNILINKKESDKNKSKKENVPKVVELAYKINCVSDVSAVSCTFEVDIKIFLFWTDEKLIGRKKESFVDYETEKDLFEPNIIVTNEHQLTVVEKDCNTKINDSETGGVKRTQHFKGTVFLGSMELKMFPFDCQNLQICFKPYRLKRDECILRPKEDESAVDRHIMHEWAVLGDCVKVFFTDPSTSSTRKSYSTLFITVLARRKYNWHVTNVFIPTAAFLFISWLTFFYGANARSERNDISIATLLASISNK